VTQVKGKADIAPGKSGMSLKAQGANLAMPPVFSVNEYFDVDPSLTVQLITSDGSCWTSDFTTAQIKKNTAVQFSATGP